MLQFEENRKPGGLRKRDLKAKSKALKTTIYESSSDNNSEEESDSGQPQVRRPAWVDPHTSKMKVSIDDVSRLRKLKKTEDEAVIEGADYADRIKQHYISRIQGEHSMFDWAKPNHTKK